MTVRAFAVEERARQAEAEFKSTGSALEEHMGFRVQSNNAQPQKRPRAEDKCPAEGARGGVRAPDWKEKKCQWCDQAGAPARYFS